MMASVNVSATPTKPTTRQKWMNLRGESWRQAAEKRRNQKSLYFAQQRSENKPHRSSRLARRREETHPVKLHVWAGATFWFSQTEWWHFRLWVWMAFTVYHYSICQSNNAILNDDVEIEHVNKKGSKKEKRTPQVRETGFVLPVFNQMLPPAHVCNQAVVKWLFKVRLVQLDCLSQLLSGVRTFASQAFLNTISFDTQIPRYHRYQQIAVGSLQRCWYQIYGPGMGWDGMGWKYHRHK